VNRVVFLLVPQLHLLDLAGPAQVFSTAADLGHGYELTYVAEQEDVPTAQGLPVRAEVEWPDLGPDDLLVVPGWRAPTLGRHGQLHRRPERLETRH
jgi:transcriptional regulator GlxA family with amidase domain